MKRKVVLLRCWACTCVPESRVNTPRSRSLTNLKIIISASHLMFLSYQPGGVSTIRRASPQRASAPNSVLHRDAGTAFHFAAAYLKKKARLDGERKIYERDADSGYRIRFHFCPTAAALSIGREIVILRSAGSQWVRSTRQPFLRPSTRSESIYPWFWPAAEDGAPPGRPTTDHVRAVPDRPQKKQPHALPKGAPE